MTKSLGSHENWGHLDGYGEELRELRVDTLLVQPSYAQATGILIQ
ncbi:hypothetical protein [Candidatus Nitrospira nitrificans]|nr:hypothetical protein [Candidatus Nitrospira nitrificans]